MKWHDSLVQNLESTWQLRMNVEGKKSVLACKTKEKEQIKKPYSDFGNIFVYFA